MGNINSDQLSLLERQLAAETNNKQEFERDWLACCDKLNDERRIHLELEETLVKKLEAAQAREKVRIEALEALSRSALMDRLVRVGLEAAINQPADNAALKAALAAERERCALAIENIALTTGFVCAKHIRALGD